MRKCVHTASGRKSKIGRRLEEVEPLTEIIEERSRVPCVYVDANIYKFAATALPRLFPRKQIIDWGHTTSEHHYYELGYLNPNDRISDPAFRAEVDLIEAIATQVKIGRLRAVTNFETTLEIWGLPKMDSASGKFYSAKVDNVPAAVEGSRLLFYGSRNIDEIQQKFFRRIRHPRFLELQKLTGGYQGKDDYNSNQMLDAFALWCAEYNGCDYFLTLDLKLISLVRNAKLRPVRPQLVRPSELIVAMRALQ